MKLGKNLLHVHWAEMQEKWNIQIPSEKLSNSAQCPMRYKKSLKTFIGKQSRSQWTADGDITLHSSAGLGQVQLKCARTTVSRAIHLLRSCSVLLWASAPPETAPTLPGAAPCCPSAYFSPCSLLSPSASQEQSSKGKQHKMLFGFLPRPWQQLGSVRSLRGAPSKLCSAPWQCKLVCPRHPSLAWGNPPPQTGLPVSSRLLLAESAAGDGVIKQ